MSSEWSFDSSIGSLVVVLFMIGIMIGFGAFLYWLLAWIFGGEPDAAETTGMSRDRIEPPFREAA